jgi:DNA repair protein RadC
MNRNRSILFILTEDYQRTYGYQLCKHLREDYEVELKTSIADASELHGFGLVLVAQAGEPDADAVARLKQKHRVVVGITDEYTILFDYRLPVSALRDGYSLRSFAHRFLGPPKPRYWRFGVLGRSEAMKKVFTEIAGAARRTLIHGEAGTGKERIARLIHFEGHSSSHLFLSIRCGALPDQLLEHQLFGHCDGAGERATPGLFESAGHGTLLLRDIDEMSADLVRKLVAVLKKKRVIAIGGREEKQIHGAVLATTRRDPESLAEGLRKLFSCCVHLPPLRERGGDVSRLAKSFFNRHSEKLSRSPGFITAEAMASLGRYDWPGNVRELETTIEQAMQRSSSENLTALDLPPVLQPRRRRSRTRAVRTQLAQLSDLEVLRRILRIGRSRKLIPLLHDGLISFHQAGNVELASLSAVMAGRVRAAQYMVRRLVGQSLAPASRKERFPPAGDPGPVVRFLFLEHARPKTVVRGVLALMADATLASFALPGSADGSEVQGLRQLFRQALESRAHSLVLVTLWPGGLGEEATTEEEAQMSLAAEALGLEIADRWIVTGPARWRSVGSASGKAVKSLRPYLLGSRQVKMEEVYAALAKLLDSSPPEILDEMVATTDCLKKLAATPPDDFHHPGLSTPVNQAVAALLELTHRLGQVEVPEQPIFAGSQALDQIYLSQLGSLSGRQSLLLAVDESHHVVWQGGVDDGQSRAELSRFVLEAALNPRVVALVPVLFVPSGPAALPTWQEELDPEVLCRLSAFGARWDAPLGLSAEPEGP